MARKHGGAAEVEKENSERWLLTYADMITLLLILFIVLYAMSSISKSKIMELSQALTIVFGGSSRALLDGHPSLIQGYQKSKKELKKSYVKAVSQFQNELANKKMRIVMTESGIKVSMSSDFFFQSGSADFTSEATDVIQKLASIFSANNNKIRIEGHTDNVPIAYGSALAQRYPTNWELSSQRAINVLRLLEREGIRSDRLSALAYGDTKSSKSNETEEGRRANRRVEIYVLTDMEAEKQQAEEQEKNASQSSTQPAPQEEPASQIPSQEPSPTEE